MKEKWQNAGVCGVDSGMIHIGDPCYLRDSKENPYLDEKKMDKLWGSLKDAEQLHYALGHEGMGVLIGGFGGDGTYNVYIKKNKNGLVTEAKIVFDEVEKKE